jgi:hypothetical protein
MSAIELVSSADGEPDAMSGPTAVVVAAATAVAVVTASVSVEATRCTDHAA